MSGLNKQARHDGDLALIARLEEEDFQGPNWDKFVDSLIAYANGPLSSQIRSGRVFAECTKRGIIWLPSRNGSRPKLQETDIQDLTSRTMALAIFRFRKILRSGGWSAQGGTQLTTYFFGQCYIQFPTAYKGWLKDRRPDEWISLERDDGTVIEVKDNRDEVQNSIEQLDLNREFAALDNRTRSVLVLRMEGYSGQEIGERLGLSVKAVEALLYRYRRRWANRNRRRRANRKGGI
jgi:DNA-directed RNA polymerase specialized sigma24 family protein